MREIKFRVWNKRSKRMIYDCGLAIRGNMVIEESGNIVTQFTGLKDKNGKEIFEGDKVRYAGTLFEIFWEEETTSFRLKSKGVLRPQITKMMKEQIEIIGNIFENPELLDKGEKAR